MTSPQTSLKSPLKSPVKALVLLVGSAALFAACGGSPEEEATPASLPFDESSEASEDVEAVEPETTTSTTIVVTVPVSEPISSAPPTTATTGPKITYGEDFTEGTLIVTGVSENDVLNVRSGPGVDNDIIGVLDPNSRFVKPTGVIATVDGVLWREINHTNGTTGFVHSNFVTFNDAPCLNEPTTGTALSSDIANGDVDGDGESDDLKLLVREDGIHLEIGFAHGGYLTNFMGEPSSEMLEGFAGMNLSVADIDGNGTSEIRIDSSEGRWTGTTFYRVSDTCEVWGYGNGGSVFDLGVYGSAGSPISFACANFGTPDVRVITSVGSQTEDGMTFTITTYAFDINEGFVSIADAPPFEVSGEDIETYNRLNGPCELT